MERAAEKRWHLIRNNNGEWISEEHAVFLSKFELIVLKMAAVRVGKELHVQQGPEGSCWCYKHEVEMLDDLSKQTAYEPRKLRINKK